MAANRNLDLPPSMGGSGKPIVSSTVPGQSAALAKLAAAKLPAVRGQRSRLVAALARRPKGADSNFLP